MRSHHLRYVTLAACAALVGCSALAIPITDDGGLPADGGLPPGDAATDLAGSFSQDFAGSVAPDGGTNDLGDLFGPATVISLPAAVEYGDAVAVGDVNGDGQNDVVVEATTNDALDGKLIVLPQNAAGSLGAPTIYSLGQPAVVQPGTIGIGDLDGDSRLDVAAPGNHGVAVMRQDGAGALAAPQLLAGSSACANPNLVSVADVDGDGRADVVAGGTFCDGIDIWEQTAQGTLGAVQHFGCPGSGYDDLAIGDLNGDRRPDVALMVGGQACLLLSSAAGFASYQTLPLDGMATGIAAGDVNHDGRDDLVVTGGGNQPSSYLRWYAQTAQGTLDAPRSMASLDLPGEVQLADVDGDGWLDALTLHDGFFAMGIYRQVATGGFAPEQTIHFEPTTRFVVGDVSGDHRPDLVAIAASNSVTIYYHR